MKKVVNPAARPTPQPRTTNVEAPDGVVLDGTGRVLTVELGVVELLFGPCCRM